ncbi:MAG: 3-phosphoshikimate 1-carboxyvinyltransferase [Flavobacteriales bacterium]|nr:3-phosphoshikimate 1-carboxyvinyltransferase [Flavobacteriales bacterium]PIV95116.1 MAG: 3-phosphoshikimate 1-carboxyvinyltransferase [Flavobacteriaceae bacterium CG17_big_fil_post_rev_8_21_14_2_50_33_15]PJB19353.1 MAG: 3-phosphoshikimate 1-carboxyvinyltransferase [Flavobacteriaceae bacterium CG_4_9_14_3_um_filter_33_16]NCP90864.1 3-phosphoshikimate 1-carboxyvinyltransferase [Flavobacteriales bacterium]NCQ58936.1 3-phosphoshikimate 1-carboxyvinyltransferase [Flavobacteriales bacterium]
MNIILQKSIIQKQSSIEITGSKSESNRLLLLQALFPELSIENVSNSDDSQLMTNALKSESDGIDIHHAGTAMRFLTAFFAIQVGRKVTLTGSKRMKERPIKILVEALQSLGAKIEYLENDGFPPLKITGQNLTKSKVTLQANVSSQYISALLLIASKLENGLELTLKGDITSIPYIKMTLSLLTEVGVESSFVDNVIIVKPNTKKLNLKTLVVESDWSSASYFYSIVAISEMGTQITLSSYKEHSLQGDSVLVDIYKHFGVKTVFKDNTVVLTKESNHLKPLSLDLKHAPDIAQTIAVTCFALGISCDLKGLHTLKIKETDRLVALKTEIEKFGGHVKITNESLQLSEAKSIHSMVAVATYNDHRMAMAFAPLALKTSLIIEDSAVVSKSYPTFWDDLKAIGFKIAQ